VRVLLDTQAFLWFITGDRRMSSRSRSVIEDPGNDLLLSIASVWEMAIKTSLGKLANGFWSTRSRTFRSWVSFGSKRVSA
jgi:PIN domain nuclease of toxin-antitoxin system